MPYNLRNQLVTNCKLFFKMVLPKKEYTADDAVEAMKRMSKTAEENNIEVYFPELKLCTDNGAMIAWAGIENYKAGRIVTEPIAPRPRWPLTEL